jgi:hypothetical protein
MPKHVRRIGRIGTASRVLVGLGLLYLALADGLTWDLTWGEAVFGVAVFPAVMVAIGLAARRFAGRPVHGPRPPRRRRRGGARRRPDRVAAVETAAG